jgi:Uma2 family endonuclease
METALIESKKISYEEFLEQSDEDIWAEWVDGEIIMVPSASERHQDINVFLTSILRFYVDSRKLGKLYNNPYQMKLESSGREPDIVFVSTEHLNRIKYTYLEGPADMVVEIVSPESMRRDRGDKFYEYESAGIPEYWLIDPIRKQAEFYRLGADKLYHLISTDAEDIYRSEIVKGFWLKVSWLWEEPLPSVLDAWKEINGN